jgi:hypothetical protein
MGIIKTAVKTAVAVKTAHFVHDRIQQRQGEKWASQHALSGPPAVAAATGTDAQPAVDDTLARLTQLGNLRASGVLTESEFEAQKARILAASAH